MSEADRLWIEAMEALAVELEAFPPSMVAPEGLGWLRVIAGFARDLPRPAGWGEEGKDE